MDELLVKHNIILQKSKNLSLKEFKTRSYKALFGVDLKSNNTILFFRDAKSRFLQKDSLKLIQMSESLAKKENRIVKKKIFFYNSQICSKALEFLKKNGWKCYFVM